MSFVFDHASNFEPLTSYWQQIDILSILIGLTFIYLIFRGDFILLVLVITILLLMSNVSTPAYTAEEKTTLTFKAPADVKTFDFNDWVSQSIKSEQRHGKTSFLFQVKW